MGLYFPGTGTMGCAVWPGAGITAPKVSLLIFTHHTTQEFGTATPHPLHLGSPAPPLLPFWMNMASLNTWLLHFHMVQFSGISGCFCFEVSFDPSYSSASMSPYVSILTGSLHSIVLKEHNHYMNNNHWFIMLLYFKGSWKYLKCSFYKNVSY